ncbi:NADP-dependent malic enzyme [Patescibacteria group bacterium]|nr:NADP-dependent malic enzyme [Patescibacteria group bacterium]
MNNNKDVIAFSQQLAGKIEVGSKKKLTKNNLPLLYTPGVAEISNLVASDSGEAYHHTIKANTVAVVSDGSAVLGLGNLGPLGALPVMEGKALLFKELAGVDAFPIVLDTQDTEAIIETVKNIAPTFGGINLEDIAAPRCFEIEERLKRELDIPVFHDDQHGTAIVVLAGLYNALRVVGKELKTVKIVISGAGAAGIAIAKLLAYAGAERIILADRTGAIYTGRVDGMNPVKSEIATVTNPDHESGTLQDILKGADVFIGVSGPNLLIADDITHMNQDAIVFAMSNPIPEIMPDDARRGGARIVATGRSDFANQINNMLVFPGLFRGALDARVHTITDDHKIAAARALADLVRRPNDTNIIPKPLDKKAVRAVASVFQQ